MDQEQKADLLRLRAGAYPGAPVKTSAERVAGMREHIDHLESLNAEMLAMLEDASLLLHGNQMDTCRIDELITKAKGETK